MSPAMMTRDLCHEELREETMAFGTKPTDLTGTTATRRNIGGHGEVTRVADLDRPRCAHGLRVMRYIGPDGVRDLGAEGCDLCDAYMRIEGVRLIDSTPVLAHGQPLDREHALFPLGRIVNRPDGGLNTLVLPSVLARHAAGDFGIHGERVVLDDDARFCPALFDRATRNSVAIDAGWGAVWSRYPLGDSRHQVVDVVTVLEPGHELTAVAVGDRSERPFRPNVGGA